VQRDIYICDRPIRHVNFFFSQRSHHISAAVVNAQGHSRSPAAVSGQVAYRCAVYSLIILYVKREAVIVLMKLSVGILMLLLSCVYIQYDVASRRAFFTEKKSFLLKAKRFRTAVPFSLSLLYSRRFHGIDSPHRLLLLLRNCTFFFSISCYPLLESFK
jgi:hypothetical protein